MSQEVCTKNASLTFDGVRSAARQNLYRLRSKKSAPLRGYVLWQRGLTLILETSYEKALDRWFAKMPNSAIFQFQPLESLAHIQERNLKKFRSCSI